MPCTGLGDDAASPAQETRRVLEGREQKAPDHVEHPKGMQRNREKLSPRYNRRLFPLAEQTLSVERPVRSVLLVTHVTFTDSSGVRRYCRR